MVQGRLVKQQKARAARLAREQHFAAALAYDQHDDNTCGENWLKLTDFLSRNKLLPPADNNLKNYNAAVKENVEDLCAVIEKANQDGRKIYWSQQRITSLSVPGKKKKKKQEPELDESNRQIDFYSGIEYSHNPQHVDSLVLVNGGAYSGTLPGGEEGQKVANNIDNKIKVPGNDVPFVTNTQEDGEVSELIEALKKFVAAMKDRVNRRKLKMTFSVDLAGQYGACEACKVRIAKFCQLWASYVSKTLYTGVQATLTVTYRYQSQACEPRNDGNIYGWEDDPWIGDWYVHVEVEQATGGQERPQQNQ